MTTTNRLHQLVLGIAPTDKPHLNEPMLNAGRESGPAAQVYLDEDFRTAIHSDSVDALYTLADALVAAAQRLEVALTQRQTLRDIDGRPLPMAQVA